MGMPLIPEQMTGQVAKDYAKYDNLKRIVYEIYAF